MVKPPCFWFSAALQLGRVGWGSRLGPGGQGRDGGEVCHPLSSTGPISDLKFGTLLLGRPAPPGSALISWDVPQVWGEAIWKEMLCGFMQKLQQVSRGGRTGGWRVWGRHASRSKPGRHSPDPLGLHRSSLPHLRPVPQTASSPLTSALHSHSSPATVPCADTLQRPFPCRTVSGLLPDTRGPNASSPLPRSHDPPLSARPLLSPPRPLVYWNQSWATGGRRQGRPTLALGCKHALHMLGLWDSCQVRTRPGPLHV